MVAVAQYHGFDVFRPPAVEQNGVVFRQFGRSPSVERFVDDQKPQVVARIEECLGGRIMRGAYGVESGLFHQSCLTPFRVAVGGGTERTVVVMHASAVQFYGFTVQDETFFGTVFHVAHPERSGDRVGRFSIVRYEATYHPVEVRCFRIPELGVFKRELQFDFACPVSFKGDSFFLCENGVTVQVGDRAKQCGREVFIAVGERGFHFHLRFPVHLFGGDTYAPRFKMCLGGTDKFHVAVNAGTGVPTAVLLSRVVHTHGNDILARFEVRRDVVVERRITVGTYAEIMSVDEYFRIHVNPFEIEGGFGTSGVRYEIECLAVPADAGGIIPSVVTGRIGLFRTAFNAPVMGQVQRAPVVVVEVRTRGYGGIT